jgi:hypothetical protein
MEYCFVVSGHVKSKRERLLSKIFNPSGKLMISKFFHCQEFAAVLYCVTLGRHKLTAS